MANKKISDFTEDTAPECPTGSKLRALVVTRAR